MELDLVLDLAVRALALVDLHAVQARRQRLDRLQHRDDLRVLLLRDLAGDEDAEVADVLVHRPTITWPRALISSVVPYMSATQLNACCGGVMLSPSEANRMIGDLISRRSNALPPGSPGAGPELVADEEVARDPVDLLAVHQVVATPPALELEEARVLVSIRSGTGCRICRQKALPGLVVLEVLRPGWRRRSGHRRGRRSAPRARRRPPGHRRSAWGCRRRASWKAPAQYDSGAPLMTSGPVSSGSEAASIMPAYPPWQLPTITGLGLAPGAARGRCGGTPARPRRRRGGSAWVPARGKKMTK